MLRSGWNSGGTHGERLRLFGTEWGGIWGGVSLPQPTRGLGSVVSSPSGVRGRVPTGNGFWLIPKATERSFLYLYDKIYGDGNLFSVPLQILGTCPPWSTPMHSGSITIVSRSSYLSG